MVDKLVVPVPPSLSTTATGVVASASQSFVSSGFMSRFWGLRNKDIRDDQVDRHGDLAQQGGSGKETLPKDASVSEELAETEKASDRVQCRRPSSDQTIGSFAARMDDVTDNKEKKARCSNGGAREEIHTPGQSQRAPTGRGSRHVVKSQGFDRPYPYGMTTSRQRTTPATHMDTYSRRRGDGMAEHTYEWMIPGYGCVRFTDHAPLAFEALRRKFGYSNTTPVNPLSSLTTTPSNSTFPAAQHLPSTSNSLESTLLNPFSSLYTSKGKSQSVFFGTHDKRVLFKTLRGSEAENLKGFLMGYLEHVEEWGDTFLPRFLGMGGFEGWE
ncbi:hypothetical protein HK102_006853 [Quaeritorhiza haematococci]|nr:hypothetical protein HK102_006853 [Quaeritorhiza haematococci]